MNSHQLPKDSRNAEETTNPGLQFQFHHFECVGLGKQLPVSASSSGTDNTSKSHQTSWRNLHAAPTPPTPTKSRTLIEWHSKPATPSAQPCVLWKTVRTTGARISLKPQHFDGAWEPWPNSSAPTQPGSSPAGDMGVPWTQATSSCVSNSLNLQKNQNLVSSSKEDILLGKTSQARLGGQPTPPPAHWQLLDTITHPEFWSRLSKHKPAPSGSQRKGKGKESSVGQELGLRVARHGFRARFSTQNPRSPMSKDTHDRVCGPVLPSWNTPTQRRFNASAAFTKTRRVCFDPKTTQLRGQGRKAGCFLICWVFTNSSTH